jgi:ion channel-forming bestrophin family protein
MQTRRRYSLAQTLNWTRGYVAALLAYSAGVVALDQLAGLRWVRLPWLPMSLIGIAVAFTLGFKNNSSYGRLWDARTFWGAIVNSSRAWGIMVRGFVGDAAAHRVLVDRHLAWLTALRYQLRASRSWEHAGNAQDEALKASQAERKVPLNEAIAPYLAEAERGVLATANPAAQILARQSEHLRELERSGSLEQFRYMQMVAVIVELYDHQGRCERVKNFPFPRQYATLNQFALWAFILLLPFGMLSTFDESMRSVWLVVPFSTLVGWIFVTMELIGDYSENPFEGLWNDVPITALCRTIEIDLRQMFGETDVPPALAPVDDILS